MCIIAIPPVGQEKDYSLTCGIALEGVNPSHTLCKCLSPEMLQISQSQSFSLYMLSSGCSYMYIPGGIIYQNCPSSTAWFGKYTRFTLLHLQSLNNTMSAYV